MTKQAERIITPIIDIFNNAPETDTTEHFKRLWSIMDEMHAKITKRFKLERDPCCDDLLNYTAPTGMKGNTEVYAGPEVDWYVHSWCGHPKKGFTNMHITITLGPQILVPNFGCALGTIPKLFMYNDLIPRVDTFTNIDYVDEFYTEVNEEFLSFAADNRFKPFISRDLYTRFAITPTAVGYSAEPEDEIFDKIREVYMNRLDRWLKWVDQAPKTPVEMREQIAQRDHIIRRNICERDPANNMADEFYGKELGDRLVKTISAQCRTLPRPSMVNTVSPAWNPGAAGENKPRNY
jgi:hypothetical protein